MNKKLFCVLEAIISTMAICFFNSMQTVSIFPFIIFIISCFFFINNKIEKNKFTVIPSIIITIFLLFGKSIVLLDESSSIIIYVIKLIVCLIGSMILCINIISIVYLFFDKKKLKKIECSIKVRTVFLVSFIIIFILSFIVLLAEYPGIVMQDTIAQFRQVFGLAKIDNINPIIHTLYMKILYNISSLFVDDINSKIFVMSFIQILLNSIVFSVIGTSLYKKTNNLLLPLVITVFYGLISFNITYSVCLTKDTMFAISVVFFIYSIIEFAYDNSIKNKALIIISLVLICLLRKNGLYAFIFTTVVITLISIIKKKGIKNLLIVYISLIISFSIQFFVFPMFSIKTNGVDIVYKEEENIDILELKKQIEDNYNNPQSFVDKLDSICYRISLHLPYIPTDLPTQQIASVVANDRELNEKEIWLIEERCPLNIIKENYDKYVVDPIYKVEDENIKASASVIPGYEYFKLWLELFVKYPRDYIESYLYMTRYYFYPNREVQTNCYGIAENKYGIKNSTLISSQFTDGVIKCLDMQREIPIIGSLFSPGTIVSLAFVVMFYGFRTNRISISTITLVLIGIWLTLMVATPTGDCFRYIYPVVITTPLIILLPFIKLN